MSLSQCTPRSWFDDRDSDVSDPDSHDRVTIYTNELSPTPSEMFQKSVRSHLLHLHGPLRQQPVPAAPVLAWRCTSNLNSRITCLVMISQKFSWHWTSISLCRP